MGVIQLIFFEYILGYAFQAFILVLGLYAFNKQIVQPKQYIYSSLIVTMTIYIARVLPINFGVHMLLSMLMIVLLGVWYLKMPIYPVIKSALVVTVVIILSELINVSILKSLFGETQFQNFMNNALKKAIVGIPSSLMFGAVVFFFYLYNTSSKRKSRDRSNGNIS